MSTSALAFDASSARTVDENGFLHVTSSHITKATVNPYYGREIPGWQAAGLDPEKIYYGLRDPRELQKSLRTWEGLPLHIEHHIDSADEPRKLTRVGAVGTGAVWNAPYIDAPLTVWDRAAIDAIEDGSFRELSCAYRYDPDFTPGQHEGVAYDFIMRNIRGNHVALVEEGRAGPDVVVADAALWGEDAEEWRTAKNGKKYQIETETGEVLKGNLGRKAGSGYQSRPLESAAPDTARYEALLKEQGGDAKRAAHEYFREKLQGRHVEAQTATGPIRACFTGGSWGELKKDMRDDPVKASLVPHLPDIITTGRYAPETPAHAHPEVTQFHTYRKTVQTSAGPKEAIVDVAERVERKPSQPEHQVYSLTREGSHAYEKRQKEAAPLPGPPGRNRGGRSAPTQDSNAAAENSVVPLFEVVNVRLAGSERPALAGDGNITKTRQSNPFTGAVMKIKHWFRGARDADPGIERQEVDLAQAIIDLHKVDPETGEIVDITEDEDKAAEIRKLIGELSGKLDPAEVRRLTDALSDLAYSKATADAEPEKGEAMDEDVKKAMDACGLDADDEDASKAFAEGVKYGEELMRNPAEREKLDREHEAEGMRKAMDSCGLDAENAQESRAFAEGVKYGEKLERDPAERRKLDREHESEGMKRAMGKDEDKNAAISRILDEVPGLTPEQRGQLEASLQDLAYSRATDDEVPDAAQDRALRRLKPAGPRPLLATDAALIQARAVAAAQDNMRRIARAVADVRPLVGELDLLAFDSASDVYGYALEQSGVNPRQYSRQAWRGMVDMLRSRKSGLPSGSRSPRDAAPARLDGAFAGLNTISIAD